MKAILDIESIAHPLTGIGRYTLALARELMKSSRVENVKLITLTHQLVLETSDELEAYIEKIIPSERTEIRQELVENSHELIHIPFWRYIPFWERIPYRHKIPFRNQFISSYNGVKHWRQDRRYRNLIPFKGFLRRGYYLYKDWKYKSIVKNLPKFIFHGPNYHLVPTSNKSVVTIHDLSVLRHPECHPKERTDFWTKEIYNVAERATQIITVSEFQRQEIIELLNVKPEKVSVVYLGVDPKFSPYSANECQDVLEKYNLQYKQYSLVVSTIEPRKNFARLLQAFKQLPIEIRQAYPLAIVGDKGWASDDIHQMISQLVEEKEVVRLGYVDEQDLPKLYAAATVFLYPSIYEGFGLPVLEAMASGTVVLTSNTSSLPEVAGDSCLLIDPYSVDDITQGWCNLLKDENLRETLSQSGQQQAKQFSWQRCAEQTIDVYAKL